MKRTPLFLVYSFAAAGVFALNFLEKREETKQRELAMRMLQQLKKHFTIHHDIIEKEFECFAVAVYNLKPFMSIKHWIGHNSQLSISPIPLLPPLANIHMVELGRADIGA